MWETAVAISRLPLRAGVAARVPGRARPSGVRGPEDDGLQPDRRGLAGRGTGPDPRLRRGPPAQGVDRGQRLADGVVRARHARPRTAEPGHRRPPSLPHQPRRPRRLGSSRALEIARLDEHTPDPPEGGSSAGTTDRRRARSTKAPPRRVLARSVSCGTRLSARQSGRLPRSGSTPR
jgi:hypothetical protein